MSRRQRRAEGVAAHAASTSSSFTGVKRSFVEENSSTLFRCELPDRSGEGCGIFPGQVMADVRNDAMLAPADELRCRRFPIRCRHDTIRVPVQRDRRHSDRRWRGEPLLKALVRWVARRKTKAMAVGMDHDVDVVGVVEDPLTAVEGRAVDPPESVPRMAFSRT